MYSMRRVWGSLSSNDLPIWPFKRTGPNKAHHSNAYAPILFCLSSIKLVSYKKSCVGRRNAFFKVAVGFFLKNYLLLFD